MYWTLVFLGVALAAAPFALTTGPAGGTAHADGAAALVTAVFAALAVGALGAELVPRLWRGAADGARGTAARRRPLARRSDPRHLRRT